MGYGGDLIFTPLLRELKKNNPNKSVYLISTNFERLQKRIGKLFYIKKNSSPIFFNNPYLSYGFVKNNSIIIDRFDPKLSYAKKELDDKYIFEEKKHAVNILFEQFKIISKNITPEIYFSKQEENIYKKKFSFLDKVDFITIEPNVKEGFIGTNRKWDFKNWQNLIDKSSELKFIQIGNTKNSNLKNLYYNFNCKLNMREAIFLIKKSKLFIGTDSGYMHASTAVGKKAIILFHGVMNKSVITYPQNINLTLDVDCRNCGFKQGFCPNNNKCMDFDPFTIKQILYETMNSLLP